MGRKATGTWYVDDGKRYARLTIGPGTKGRRAVPLPTCTTDAEAEARLGVLARLAIALRAGGIEPERAIVALTSVGAAHVADLAIEVRLAERMARHETAAAPTETIATFQQVGEAWTSGELHKRFPDHVAIRKKAEQDANVLARHLYPVVGSVRCADFSVDDGLRALQSLSPMLEDSTRSEYAKIMHRVLAIAVFPLQLIKAHPIPPNFLPKKPRGKAKAYLYPDEDRMLLSCESVHLCWRMVFGFLVREGMRFQEAAAMQWRDLDLERGAVTLDVNKTDDPRHWVLSAGVLRALRAWKAYRGRTAGARAVDPSAPVFVNVRGDALTAEHNAASKLRGYLAAAGVLRSQLFERTASRRPMRAHDTRATFITLYLAAGETETWIADRTGHKSSDQITNYRRAARTVEALNLGKPIDLDLAIPEFRNGSEIVLLSKEQVKKAADLMQEGTCPCSVDSEEHVGNDGPDTPRGTQERHTATHPDAIDGGKLGQSIPILPESSAAANPRAASVAALFAQAATAAAAGDHATAIALSAAASSLLQPVPAADPGKVVALDPARRRKG